MGFLKDIFDPDVIIPAGVGFATGGPAGAAIGAGIGLQYAGAEAQAEAARAAAQPLPTYYQYAAPTPLQTSMQQIAQGALGQMYGEGIPTPAPAQMGGAPAFAPPSTAQAIAYGAAPVAQAPTFTTPSVAAAPSFGAPSVAAAPTFSPVATGQMPTWAGVNVPAAPMPTGDWYASLDPNIRAGIEAPYLRSMDMMRNQLAGTGQLGSQAAGMSGAAADVYGQYMTQAAPAMAMTGWNMMAPGLMQQAQQQYAANVLAAQRPWEAGMTQMAQQLQAGLAAQGLTAQGALQQAGAQNQAALAAGGWSAQAAMEQARAQNAAALAAGGWGAQATMQQQAAQNQAALKAQGLTAESAAQQAAAQNQAALAAGGWGAQGTMQQLAAQNQANLLQQEQAFLAGLLPYQQLPAVTQMAEPEMIIGHTPTIQQIEPGAPLPPNTEELINQAITEERQRTGAQAGVPVQPVYQAAATRGGFRPRWMY